jgi:predicted metal-binding membrane protein
MPRVRKERLRDTLLTLAKRLSPILAAISLAGWILLFVLDRGTPLSPLCLSFATLTGTMEGLLWVALAANPPSVVMLTWLAMLVAMMSPLLTQPVAQLRRRSLKQRRRRAVAWFVLGYFAVWMTAGFVLLIIAAALGLFAGELGLPALTIAAALAALWQAGPLRQRALNRCHRVPQMSASGAEADRDCIHFGMTHGLWCAATCSPLMLLPLTSPAFHLPLMFVVSVWLVLERMVPPRRPSWTFRILPGQAVAVTLLKSIR